MSKRPPSNSSPPRINRIGGAGRPPKPIALHKLEGTYQPSRHKGRAGREPVADGDLDQKPAPSWLTPSQRELWTEVLLDAPRALLRRIDWAVFANYIEVLDRHAQLIQAQQQLNRGQAMPYLVKGPNGFAVLSPYLRAINHCVLLMARLQSEMGFTPAARARFAVINAGEDDPGEESGTGWDSLRKLRIIDGGKK